MGGPDLGVKCGVAHVCNPFGLLRYVSLWHGETVRGLSPRPLRGIAHVKNPLGLFRYGKLCLGGTLRRWSAQPLREIASVKCTLRV